jgi:hypothetical protein
VHADSQPTGTGGDVVSAQRPLAALGELALRSKCQRMRWDDNAALESVSHLCILELTDESSGSLYVGRIFNPADFDGLAIGRGKRGALLRR